MIDRALSLTGGRRGLLLLSDDYERKLQHVAAVRGEKLRKQQLERTEAHSLVEEVVSCPVTQLGSSSVILTLRAWCANAGEAKQVEFDLYEQAKNRFGREGIEIPFPYTNAVLKSETGAN